MIRSQRAVSGTVLSLMQDSDLWYAERLARYEIVRGQLSSTSDRRLTQIMAAATPRGAGVGGRSAELNLGDIRVFVKRVPLTDMELQLVLEQSTANIFELPTFYQYGLGSAGFGAWRELAAHTITTDWVLGNEYSGFPLMYHWRVLPDTAPEGFADEFGGLEGAVAHWDNSPAVRHRVEAIGQSSSSLLLFLEHVPHTLADWLHTRRDNTGVYPWAAQALAHGAAFMSSRGFVHFDAHFANILTDGRLVYFADMGLALSSEFDLSAEETDFLARHRAYDHCCTANHLLDHYLTIKMRDKEEYEAFLHDWLAGRKPADIPPELAAILDQYARPAAILNDFHRSLLIESKQTPFPNRAIEQALVSGQPPP